MQLHAEVTAEDIEAGLREDCERCLASLRERVAAAERDLREMRDDRDRISHEYADVNYQLNGQRNLAEMRLGFVVELEARNATVRAEAFREALTLARAAVAEERLVDPDLDCEGDRVYGEAVLDCLAAIGRIPGAPPPETPLPAYALVSAAKVARWLRLRAEKYIKGASARWLAECLPGGTWEHDLARLAPATTPPAAPTEPTKEPT